MTSAALAVIPAERYLERGQVVTVLARWKTPAASTRQAAHVVWLLPPRRGGPRNVLIRRAGGELVVRPFRGLRRMK